MKQFAAFGSFVAFLVGSWLPAQEQPTPADPIVELPKFVVTDSRELPPPESWRYATIPGFEILTNASDRATQRLLRDFGMFRQALGHVWPIPQRLSQTTSLIICGRGNKFDAFIPDGKSVADSAFASLFLKQGNQTAIVIDMAATTLNVLNIDNSNDAATGTDSGTVSVEHDKQLYREYVRYLLSQSEPRFGAWLEEGLSQIIMKMQFDRKWIEFAKLEDPNTVSTQGAMIAQMNAAMTADDPDAATFAGAPAEDRDFSAALRRRALIPLDKFFAIKHDSPEATNTLGNNRWGKQAYAFVHMCLYGYHGKYQKAFTTFMQRSAREPVTEAMFKECFNMSYSKMLMEIRSYCDFTVYESKYYKSKEDVIIPPPPLALRDATQSEIGRIKGEAMLLAGHKKAARSELIAPYQRGERDPNLLAAIGLYERNNGEEERARKFLQAAFVGKTTRSDACLELARYRYADAMAKPGAAEGRFSGAQVNSVLEPLLQARRQPPPQPAVYELVADTWMRSAVKPKHDDAVVVAEGAQLFPTRLKLVYQAAVVAADAGELQAAHALADHGIKYGPDEKVKKRFEDLKATLPPAPPAPAEPEPVQAQTQPTAPAGAKGKASGSSKK
jgi:hypothetical protein